MDLNAVNMLIRVAETRSFTRAAIAVGTSQPGLSRAIARLETELGVRLLHRSTRNVALTADGRALVESCAPLLAGLEEAERQLADRGSQPSGRLRLSAPSAFGRIVALPLLAGLLQQHAQLSIEAALTDRVVDLIEEGFDAALRTGPVTDARLIARPLTPLRWVTVAAPAYLQQHGEPSTLEDLAEHTCLAVHPAQRSRPAPWQFVRDGRDCDIEVGARLLFDSGDPLLEAAELAIGIAQVMEFCALPALTAGRLKRVLSAYEGRSHPLWLLYPPSRQRSPRLRVLAEALGQGGW